MREEYQPFEIGNTWRILPPDCRPPLDHRTNLIMDRGAFGSGEHETTRSCLKLLENLKIDQAQVLDLGSGTGILSIAALKQGAAHATCVDIEPSAVDACRRNCRRNNIADATVNHICGTLDKVSGSQFDLILANIYGDILIDLASDLCHAAKPGSTLLLSGILWEYNFDVRNRYEQHGCTVLKNRLLDEFSTVLLQKTD